MSSPNVSIKSFRNRLMKGLATIALGLIAAAPAVFANDQLHQIANQAKDLERDYRQMNFNLKSKTVNFEKLRTELNKIDSDIDRLKQLTAEFDASNPGMHAAVEKQWASVKMIVQLIDIYHDNKTELLNGQNPEKNVQMLRIYADGLAKRATLLHQTTAKVIQAMPASTKS